MDETPVAQSAVGYIGERQFKFFQSWELGNLGKNALRGPGINQWDMSLYKNTRISERVNTQLRFETFNTFNHTQFAALNTAISVPNPSTPVTQDTRGQVGRVTNTRDPRSIQLALKILF